MANNYKIIKDIDISDGYTRYFLYIDDSFITGADTLEKIEAIAQKVKDNGGSLHIKETIKEYTC